MTTTANTQSTFICVTVIVVSLILGGCLEIETRVKIRADGGATVTERVRFSQRLLDLDAELPGGKKVAALLSREAVLRRMQRMGEGIRLVRHEVADGPGGAKDSTAVFDVADVGKLRYVSPFPAFLDFAANNVIEFQTVPVYEGTWWGRKAGDIAIVLKHSRPPQAAQPVGDNAPPPPGPKPRDMQMLRQLQPVFQDMAQGLRLRLTVEAYCPLRNTGFGHRGRRAGVSEADLIDFSYDDLDNFGDKFLANEEVMLDILRGDLGSRNIVQHTKNFPNNHTLPVFLPAGSAYGGARPEIYLPPSRELFQQHFEGQKLTFYFEKGADKTRPAKWEEIGFQPTKKQNSQDK